MGLKTRSFFIVTVVFFLSAQSSHAALSDCADPFELELGSNQKLKFCKIPAATNVTIGSREDKRSYISMLDFADASPQIKRNFEDFYIGQFEVTQGQFLAVTEYDTPWLRRRGSNDPTEIFNFWNAKENAARAAEIVPKSSTVNHHMNAPAVGVTLGDINRFIEQLEKVDLSAEYRLPTEAEWEYAARGVENRESDFYWGDKDIKDYAVFNRQKPVLVDQCLSGLLKKNWGRYYCANDFGLMHMLGNVAEMTADDYSGSYSGLPRRAASGHEVANDKYNSEWHMVRGGSFRSGQIDQLMVHSRGYIEVNEETTDDFYNFDTPMTIGFRLVRIPHGDSE